MTLILSSFILVQIGLSGATGMLALSSLAALSQALCITSRFITDLKVGYWIGTTPKKQETWKFLRGAYFPRQQLAVLSSLSTNLLTSKAKVQWLRLGKCNGGSYSTADVEHTGSSILY